jgi:hypothetical protein
LHKAEYDICSIKYDGIHTFGQRTEDR